MQSAPAQSPFTSSPSSVSSASLSHGESFTAGSSSLAVEARGSIERPTGAFDPTIPKILPHEQVFSIQVGDTLFRLSGASLSSDAPSYFTAFFLPHIDTPDEHRPVLYLDRSADVFNMIAKHLQGYYILPSDETMFMYLWADANYFHLPRLMRQISNSESFCRIGGEEFRIPIDIFDGPGDSPNFFSLGFKAFFQGESDIRIKKSLIRPPPVAPPTMTNRSASLFRDLLNVLRGAQVEVKSDEHRRNLIRECRYYRFRGLEQRLIEYEIITTVGHMGPYEEVVMNLSDIKAAEISRMSDSALHYKRPWIDEPRRQFVFQMKNELVQLKQSNEAPFLEVRFMNTKTRGHFASVYKAALHAAFNGEKSDGALRDAFTAVINDADLTVDGREESIPDTFYLTRSQWRFKIAVNDTLVLELIKGEGYSTIKQQNKMRNFV